MAFDAADLALLCDPAMPGYAEATLTGGAKVNGLFGAIYAEAFGLVAGDDPVFVCSDGAVSAGATVTIGGTAYTAVQVKKPTRGGMIAVSLDKV